MSQHDTYLTAFELFLLTHRCVARNTHAAYMRDTRQFMGFVRAPTPEGESVRALCLRFRELLFNTGVGARSMARKLSAVRVFFQFLDEHSPGHPWPDAAMYLGQLPRMERRLPRSCSTGEIDALLTCAAQIRGVYADRTRLVIFLLYGCGLRVSELASLHLTHIHLTEGVIRVVGKGGKTRIVPLCSEVRTYISHHCASSKSSYLLSCPCGRSPDHAMSRQALWRIVRRVARRARITTRISPHVLRHAFATHCLEEGWSLRALQMVLGHERIATTEMYIHLTTKFVREEYLKRHPRAHGTATTKPPT